MKVYMQKAKVLYTRPAHPYFKRSCVDCLRGKPQSQKCEH